MDLSTVEASAQERINSMDILNGCGPCGTLDFVYHRCALSSAAGAGREEKWGHLARTMTCREPGPGRKETGDGSDEMLSAEDVKTSGV